jgi:hypothetical protein
VIDRPRRSGHSSIGITAKPVMLLVDEVRTSKATCRPVGGQTGGMMAGRNALVWRKSTRSSSGNCVEIAVSTDTGTVLMRDSQNPGGPKLEFDAAVFGEFLAFVKNGEAGGGFTA